MFNAINNGDESILQSSQFISDFQSFFGIKKLHTHKKSKSSCWIGVNIDSKRKAKEDSQIQENQDKNIVYYKVENRLWYYLFLFGTQLGDEPFCALFFSVWFWNLDATIGRKLVLVWNIIMYVGQYWKDLIKWDRPQMPTSIQVQTKWSKEYGMPSTHAMLGLAVPSAAFFFTLSKYQFSSNIAIITIGVWTLLVCTSRMYLGMHSLGDVVAGLILSGVLLPPTLAFVHVTDRVLLQNPYAPLLVMFVTLIAIIFFPCPATWSPSAVTALDVLACYQGAHLGQWALFQLGIIQMQYRPYWSLEIQYPAPVDVGIMIVRILVGGLISGLVHIFVKISSLKVASALLKDAKKDIKYTNSRMISKFLTWLSTCFSVSFLAPLLFNVLGIARQSSWKEVDAVRLWI